MVSTQFQNIDRMFDAVVDFNKRHKKNVRFVQIATEGPNYAVLFFSFLRTIGSTYSAKKHKKELSWLKIHVPHAGAPVLEGSWPRGPYHEELGAKKTQRKLAERQQYNRERYVRFGLPPHIAARCLFTDGPIGDRFLDTLFAQRQQRRSSAGVQDHVAGGMVREIGLKNTLGQEWFSLRLEEGEELATIMLGSVAAVDGTTVQECCVSILPLLPAASQGIRSH